MEELKTEIIKEPNKKRCEIPSILPFVKLLKMPPIEMFGLENVGLNTRNTTEITKIIDPMRIQSVDEYMKKLNLLMFDKKENS